MASVFAAGDAQVPAGEDVAVLGATGVSETGALVDCGRVVGVVGLVEGGWVAGVQALNVYKADNRINICSIFFMGDLLYR